MGEFLMAIVYPEEIMSAKIRALEEENKQLKAEIESCKEIVRNENAMTEKYKTGYDAAMRIIRSTYPDKFPDNYFISGESGEKDENGLPKQIHICPAYGVDWFMLYERRDITWGPEY
jgi:hypothetical protein